MLGGPNKLTATDDLAVTWLGVGSQIDGFGHVGIDHVHYNGRKTQDFLSLTGIKKFGVENIPPIVARGVLLDMTKYYAVDMVPNGTAFNAKEIDEVAKRQGVEIREGDVVLFHTGWLKQFAQMGAGEPGIGFPEPGIGVAGARYLAGKGVVAVGADTWALEAIPFEKEAERFPGPPGAIGQERHLYPREHEHGRAGRRCGLRVHVRARRAAHGRGGADDCQSRCDPLKHSGRPSVMQRCEHL